jgi:proline iminopeptidase
MSTARARDSWVAMDDGARLRVRRQGPENDIAPLIAVHGAPGLQTLEDAESMWSFVGGKRTLVTFDGRGSGRSDAQPPYSSARWASDIEGLRRWLGVEEFVLAAHSYGGFIALEYACRYPKHLAGLVVVNSAGDGSALLEHLSLRIASVTDDTQRRQLERLFSGTTRSDIDFWACGQAVVSLLIPDYEPVTEPPVGVLLNYQAHNVAFAANLPSHNVMRRLGEIICPTLVCAGRLDPLIPVASSVAIAKGISGAQLELFEGSGHNPPLEEAQAFQAAVTGFLRQGPQGAARPEIDLP